MKIIFDNVPAQGPPNAANTTANAFGIYILQYESTCKLVLVIAAVLFTILFLCYAFNTPFVDYFHLSQDNIRKSGRRNGKVKGDREEDLEKQRCDKDEKAARGRRRHREFSRSLEEDLRGHL